jgi:hypothetical protein
MTRSRAILIGSLALLLLPAAAPLPTDQYRTTAELEQRLAALKTIGVVEPIVDAYELGAGGTRTFRPEWSEAGRAALWAAIEAELSGWGWAAKRVQVTRPADRGELHDARLLYEDVGSAIVQATITNLFPAKEQRFDYSVGDVGQVAAAAQVDGLVFAQGIANISSAGRAALQVFTSTGSGVAWLTFAITDRSGDVLWFARVRSTESDVRDPGGAATLVHHATVLLPRRTP